MNAATFVRKYVVFWAIEKDKFSPIKRGFHATILFYL